MENIQLHRHHPDCKPAWAKAWPDWAMWIGNDLFWFWAAFPWLGSTPLSATFAAAPPYLKFFKSSNHPQKSPDSFDIGNDSFLRVLLIQRFHPAFPVFPGEARNH